MTTESVTSVDERLALALTKLLPVMRRCDDVCLGGDELLIHAPGFEDRTMAVCDLIRETSRSSGAVLLDYSPPTASNRLADVTEALRNRGLHIDEADIVAYDRFDPSDFETRLIARIASHGASRVLIDISTMSKLAIMLVLNACCRIQVHVRLFYAEARHYAPSRAQFEVAKQANKVHQPSLQIFTGIHGVVRVDSLASVAMQGQPSAAIVFMSFNDALTQALLNTVYPSRLFLINGRPPMLGWREEATAWIHEQVRREWGEDNPVSASADGSIPLPTRTASTFDYRETVVLVLQLYWQLSTNHRILLAPAGSKLQTIGCYLTKALHPDIHIEYPSPEGFFPNYSSGIGDAWTLDLGYLNDLIDQISSVELREYLEIPTADMSVPISE